jgi:hypothetical protein
VNVFQNYKSKQSITGYFLSPFTWMFSGWSTRSACDLSNSKFILDRNGIMKFDQNYNFQAKTYLSYQPNFMLKINVGSSSNLIFSTYTGIFRLDSNMNILSYYNSYYASYTRMYYNSSADHLLVCSTFNYPEIHVFDHDLKYLKAISISPYFPSAFALFDDKLFVSTLNGPRIYILQNEVVSSYFITICTTIGTLLVDQFGCVAALCSNSNIVQLYSTNGTYLNINWPSLFPSTNDMEFDDIGNLVISGSNGVVLLNSISTQANLASTDSVCIVNSNFFNILLCSLTFFLKIKAL